MHFPKKICNILLTCLFALSLSAQDDSLDLAMKHPGPVSELKISIGYTSNVLSAGRDFEVPQYGIFPSVRYYHKSGFTAGISGSWLEKADPQYSITNLSAGYTAMLNDTWMLDLTYTHSIYNPDSNALLTNSIAGSVLYSIKWFNAGIDYSYLFGSDESGHQLGLSTGGFFHKNTKGIISGISIAPAITGVMGTSNMTVYNLPLRQYKLGTGETWQRLLERTRNRRNNTEGTENAFGWLNTELSLPVSISTGRFSLLVSCTYSIPRQFEGETEKPEAKGFFSSVLTFTL